MAERRMFAKTIIDSDAFLDMPLSAQALYFHLSMRADDDGFINNPKKIQRMICAPDDDLKLLVAKGFVIPFDSGIVVIKHWRIHNYIQKDRYKETNYTEEKQQLILKKNGSYSKPDTACIQNVSSLETQVRLGKDSIGKVSIGKGDRAQSATHLIEESSLSDPVKEKLNDWIQYKKERREGYKETGLKSLITQAQKYEQKYGSSAVINIIGISMASGYRGIVWDRLDKAPAKKTYTRDEIQKAAEYLDSGGTFLGDLFSEQYRDSEDP